MHNEHSLNGIDLARSRQRFGLAELTFIPDRDTARADGDLANVECDLASILQLICEAVQLPESSLGQVWLNPAGHAATKLLRIAMHATNSTGQEGSYDPESGLITLIGSATSLPHEFGHAIDFRLTSDGSPWSWGTQWREAVLKAPEFRLDARLLNARLPYRMRYHTTPHELFARAFECFVLDNATSQSAAAPDLTNKNGYPRNEERVILNDAIDTLVISRLQKGS